MGKSSTHNQLAKLITSTVKIAVSEAMAEAKAELRAELSPNEELLNYVELLDKPKSNASKKRKAKKVEPTRIDMPEGWETAKIQVEVPDTSEDAEEGATCIEVRTGNEHRRLSYLEARAKGKSYGVANRAGLNAVAKALA